MWAQLSYARNVLNWQLNLQNSNVIIQTSEKSRVKFKAEVNNTYKFHLA